MEALLKHASMAWNPVGNVRRRLDEGTLNPSETIVTYVGIAVACNLVAAGAQSFFFDSVAYVGQYERPEIPLTSHGFSQRLLSVLGILIPIGLVALLPRQLFSPSNRSETTASLFIVAASWAFYGAIISIPAYYISGIAVVANPISGLNAFIFLSLLSSIAIILIVSYFWLVIFGSILKIPTSSIIIIGVSILGISIVMIFVLFPVFVSSV